VDAEQGLTMVNYKTIDAFCGDCRYRDGDCCTKNKVILVKEDGKYRKCVPCIIIECFEGEDK